MRRIHELAVSDTRFNFDPVLKPHTVSVTTTTQSKSAQNVVFTPIVGTTQNVRGWLRHRQFGHVAYDEMTGVTFDNPYYFQCDASDASKFKYGYRVVYGSQKFIVRSKPQIHSEELVGAFLTGAEVTLEQTEFL
jgi:hypothetical protein